MPRVKSGVTAHARHKKILKLAKGYRGARSKQFKKANELVMKALTMHVETVVRKKVNSVNFGSLVSMLLLVQTVCPTAVSSAV